VDVLGSRFMSVSRIRFAHADRERLMGALVIQCYFLQFGNAGLPILYAVENLRDGRSYATRTVKAIQKGRVIFTMTCSFHTPEPQQPSHQIDIPPLPPSHYKATAKAARADWEGSTTPVDRIGQAGNLEGRRNDASASAISSLLDPEDCLSSEANIASQLKSGVNLPVKVREYLTRVMDERRQSSIEFRSLDRTFTGGVSGDVTRVSTPHRAQWIRSRERVKRDHRFQKCILAYASDFQFIGAAAGALGLGNRTNPRLSMISSVSQRIIQPQLCGWREGVRLTVLT
jgi:acyl-CoA thioesterase 8